MKKIFVLIYLALAAHSYAQTRINDNNNIIWTTLTVTPNFGNKFAGHIELQDRRVNWFSEGQQDMIRVGMHYKITPQVKVLLGYAWVDTYPYGDPGIAKIPKTFPEHRIFEQLIATAPIGKVTLTNRLRIEQRWIGRIDYMDHTTPDTWVYLNRIRYMPRIDVPITKKVYAAAYDEILIGFGKNVGENVFDQNRISALVGYNFTKHFKAEAGFLNQTLQLGREVNGKNVFQYNNGIIINTYLQIN